MYSTGVDECVIKVVKGALGFAAKEQDPARKPGEDRGYHDKRPK